MMKNIGRLIGIAAAIGLGFFIRGFMPAGGPPPGAMGMGAMPPPAVIAVELKERPLDILDEYIATIEPVQDVMVRSEVTGYIDEVHFTEGSFVQEGDLLFIINQRQYEAVVAARQAELNRTEKLLQRMQNADSKSVSASDLEKAESDHLQAKANLELALIDLDYSKVRAPISGRIGDAMMTKGNYVSVASEVLAHIVQTDPIRVVLSMTDRAYLDLRERELAGSADSMAARVRLPNGTMLPHVGHKDFTGNEMDSKTGTMAVRYLFDNPDSLLVAGGYVNILLGPAERPMGIRVPQQAVMQDPQGSYVLTVNEEGQVGTARVELGRSVETDRVVLSGLQTGDRVVIEGVQKVQPGMTAVVTLQENGQ
jgi:RND family efflux transporter MFP subunit